MKNIQDMTVAEMESEIRQLLSHDKTKNFVFVSYSHRDKDTVYPKVLSWMRQGYNIYLDLDFENHGSDDNWVDIMEDKIGLPTCTAAICFRSVNYYYSYASLIELLTMRSEDTEMSRAAGNDLKIDVISASEVYAERKNDVPEEYEEYFRKLRDGMGDSFCKNNPKEKTLLQRGFESWDEKLTEAQKKEFHCKPNVLLKYLEKNYANGWKFFYPYVFFIIDTWFATANLNGNFKSLNWDPGERFKELKVYQDPDMRAETEHLEATSTEADAPAEPRRRGRPPKSAQAAPTPAPASAVETLRTTPAPAPVKPETPRELPAIMPGELPTLEIKRDCTLADIRKAFSNPDIVRRFKPVREDMPRGGKGAMDYAMAAILGGCNAVKADSPIYQINYYLYAVAANGDKDGSLGATWTWSSNCRKLLGLEKNGQIPAEYNEYFRQMPENITLQQIGEYFVDANKEAFHTFRNALIIIGINRLSEFMADLT